MSNNYIPQHARMFPRVFRVVESMPIEMYGDRRFTYSQTSRYIMLYMVGCGKAREIEWRLNHINSIKYIVHLSRSGLG